ncbi:hypothetical protein [Pseudomonas migulae]
MASSKMHMLERQFARREERIPVPDTSGGIGAAIEELIAGEVARKVGEVEKAANNKKLDRLFNKPERPMTDFKQLPAMATAPAPKIRQVTIERDGAGMSRAMVIDGQRFLLQRDGAFNLIGMVADDEPTALNIDEKAAHSLKPERRGVWR